jgi:Co/Zn/Cd efflux system component
VWHRLAAFDALIAGAALALMLLIPLLEIGLRPLFGKGIENAPVLVQHLGLVLAMFGALVAERGQHLSSLGAGLAAARDPACGRPPGCSPRPARRCCAAC